MKVVDIEYDPILGARYTLKEKYPSVTETDKAARAKQALRAAKKLNEKRAAKIQAQRTRKK